MLSVATAQDMTVNSVIEATDDTSASDYPQADVNGDPTALVKVTMPVNNATFEGSVIGNVSELCQDWNAPYPHWLIAPSEYKGPETGTKRIIRGGGIYSVGYTYEHYSQRGREIPYYYACDLGLRLAL